MKCPEDGILRSWIDGELSAGEAKVFGAHLAGCEHCGMRVEKMRAASDEVRRALALLEPVESAESHDAQEAFAKFKQDYLSRSGARPRFSRAWLRPVGGALAAGLVLTFLIGFAPARSWGQRILAMLRVQKLTVVPVDLPAMETEGKNGRSAGQLLTQMISDSAVVTMKPGEPQPAPDLETASRMAGFAVRSLNSLGTPKIFVQGEAAFHTTLNRERMQDLLDQVGRPDIQVPASADGSTIAVHVSKMAVQAYGDCPKNAKDHNNEAPKGDSGETRSGNCIALLQTPSPVVSVPPSLDIAALAEAGLEAAGMNAADAHAFCKTVDWSSTLVIPVPQRGSSIRTVQVDGVNGELIESAARGKMPTQFALMWVKDGMVYSLNGPGNGSQALAAVSSMD